MTKGNHNDEMVSWQSLTRPRSAGARLRQNTRKAAKKIAIRMRNLIRTYPEARGDRILAYHLVLPEDRGSFIEQIRFLQDHFIFSRITDLFPGACQERSGPKYRIFMTFDDGFRILLRDCLEILNRFSIPAAFFVPTDFIELSGKGEDVVQISARAHYYYQRSLEPMNPEDLKILTRLGHQVWSHGMTHTSFSSLSKERALKELEGSREKIKQWTSIPPAGFSYPYGHSTHVDGIPAKWVREMGYSYGFTLRRGKVTPQSDPFLLPREHAEGNWTVEELKYFLLS